MNIYHYLSTVVSRHPDKIAVKFRDARHTYRQLDERVGRLANALSALGVAKGRKIGLICRNCDAYPEIFFAAAKLGATSEHFSWRFQPEAVAELVERSDASVLFISAPENLEFHRCLKEKLKRPITCVMVGDVESPELRYETLLRDQPAAGPVAEVEPDDLALVLYTSATTGKAKGVELSAMNFLVHTMIAMIELGWSEDTVYLGVLPLFHAASAGTYCTLLAGGTMVLLDRFEPVQYLRTIERESVTRSGLVPNLIEWLLTAPEIAATDLRSLHTIVYSGAPISPDTLRRAVGVLGCRFLQLYGMTELSPNVAFLPHEEHLVFMEKDGGATLPVGRPTMGTRVKILDEAGGECPTGACGEIVVASDSLMKGYYQRPELTAEVMRGGWYHTGDAGWLDELGYLHLAGRKEQMIICGGENIYPREIEETIRAMGRGIADVAVIGIPSKRWGEAVKALVVLQPDGDATGAAIIAHCARHLDPYKKPRFVQFVNELARNDSGKILYNVLKERYGNQDGYADTRFSDRLSVYKPPDEGRE